MKKITWANVPSLYGVCIHTDCPLAQHCLRGIAFALIPDDAFQLRMVNPRQCTRTSGCPYYRSDEPVAFAYGFQDIKEHLVPKQAKEFAKQLTDKFGRMGFYRRRSGQYATTPDEQAFIRQVLSDIGAPAECDFDEYRAEYAWLDVTKDTHPTAESVPIMA